MTYRRRVSLLFIAPLLALAGAAAGCGSDAVAPPPTDANDASADAGADVAISADSSADASSDGGPDAGDAGDAADSARAADTSTPAPRTCGVPLTTATPLDVAFAWGHKTRPFFLGQGTSGRTLLAATYASGAPARAIGSGIVTTSAAGPDDTKPMASILDLAPERGGSDPATFDNFDGAPFAATELDAPTPTRITFAMAWGETGAGWSIDPANATAETPDAGAFVRSFAPARYFGFTLAVTFASACARLAVEDVLGRSAIVTQIQAGTASTLLDPALRAPLEQLLVRDGASMRLAIVSNVPRAAVAALVAQSTCTPASLGACADLVTALEAQSQALSASASDPTFDPLVNATDPEWSVVRIGVGDVTSLGPKP